MTENEAIEKIRAYSKCLERQVKGIYEDCNNKRCDDCDLCYMQGTTGEHRKTIDIAIQALEEVQQYRAIGTPEECKEAMEKQTAKKPIVHQCPACGNAVMLSDGKCCSNCGQRLDWSDVE